MRIEYNILLCVCIIYSNRTLHDKQLPKKKSELMGHSMTFGGPMKAHGEFFLASVALKDMV